MNDEGFLVGDDRDRALELKGGGGNKFSGRNACVIPGCARHKEMYVCLTGCFKSPPRPSGGNTKHRINLIDEPDPRTRGNWRRHECCRELKYHCENFIKEKIYPLSELLRRERMLPPNESTHFQTT